MSSEVILVILWFSLFADGDGGMKMTTFDDLSACETVDFWLHSPNTRPSEIWPDTFQAKCFTPSLTGEEILLLAKWSTPNGNSGLLSQKVDGVPVCQSIRDWVRETVAPQRWAQGFNIGCFPTATTTANQ